MAHLPVNLIGFDAIACESNTVISQIGECPYTCGLLFVLT